MLKIRWSRDRLIFNMGITIHGKDNLYIETGPRSLNLTSAYYDLPSGGAGGRGGGGGGAGTAGDVIAGLCDCPAAAAAAAAMVGAGGVPAGKGARGLICPALAAVTAVGKRGPGGTPGAAVCGIGMPGSILGGVMRLQHRYTGNILTQWHLGGLKKFY